VDFLGGRGFLSVNGDSSITLDYNNEDQVFKAAFLCTLIHPYVDTYAVTLAFFATPLHQSQTHDEEFIYGKI
jgi:hypothetical protein